jgi:hypothetical protein
MSQYTVHSTEHFTCHNTQYTALNSQFSTIKFINIFYSKLNFKTLFGTSHFIFLNLFHALQFILQTEPPLKMAMFCDTWSKHTRSYAVFNAINLHIFSCIVCSCFIVMNHQCVVMNHLKSTQLSHIFVTCRTNGNWKMFCGLTNKRITLPSFCLLFIRR